MHHIVSMWNLKNNDTTEFIYKTETDSQILRMNLWLPEEKGVREVEIDMYELNWLGAWNWHVCMLCLKQMNNKGRRKG